MIKSAKKWSIERPNENIVTLFMEQLKITSLQAKILIARGIETIEEAKKIIHIEDFQMHDPFLFYQMDVAVERIHAAIESDKKIVIYGDYDADGVTSVTILMTILQQLGAEVSFVIPNRFDHGYGPHKALFKEIHEQGASMIITVDNGVAAVEEIAYAQELGMEIIVTDHHEPGEKWPEADAVLHPRHPKGNYPFHDLAGVGVAFKLATALLGEAPEELLEIVAIGTVADLVPLKDENRYFVRKGIEQLRVSQRPAIQALANVGGTIQTQFNEESIGFMIGPRLNAPGRLGDAGRAVELLLTEDPSLAIGIAKELSEINKERQDIVTTIAKEAEAMVQQMYGDETPAVIVLAKEGWHPGVVGIVASRIVEAYYRPTIILAIDSETGLAKGSGRSIDGFHLYNELHVNQSLLTHYGGHPVAAGLSLPTENIDRLRENLIAQGEAKLSTAQLIPKLSVDVPLKLDEIDIDTLTSLDSLRPFGMHFEKPIYLIEDVKAASTRRIGGDKSHLKLEVTDGEHTLDIIGFGFGKKINDISPSVRFSVVGDLQINEWNGMKKPQMLLEDLQSDEWQLFDLRGIREVTRWLHVLPKEDITFLAFNDSTVTYFAQSLQSRPIQLFGNHHVATGQSLVLLDIPKDVKDLVKLVQETKPNRIYAHFYVEASTYFDTIPDRQQFGWYYEFLKKRQSFDLNTHAERLAQHRKLKKEDIYFMSNVFFELGFVMIESGVITMQEPIEKRQLTEAPTYQQRESQMEMEKKLLYAPYAELKTWFDEMTTFGRTEEEQR